MTKLWQRIKNSLVSKIILMATVLIVFIALFWSGIWHRNAMTEVIENKVLSAQIINNQLLQGLEQKVSIVSSYLEILSNDSSLKQVIGYVTSDREQVEFVNKNLTPTVNLLMYQLNEIQAVRIIHGNDILFNVNNLLWYDSDFDDKVSDWKTGDSAAQITYSSGEAKLYPFTSFSIPDSNVWYISKFVQVQPSSKPFAFIEVAISNEIFTEAIKKINTDNSFSVALICWDGQRAVSNEMLDNLPDNNLNLQAKDTSSLTVGNKKYHIVVEPSTLLQASVITVIDDSALTLAPARRRQIVFVVAIVALCMLIFAVVGYKIILKRLDTLTKAVDSLEPNAGFTPIKESGNDEISRLIRHFNRMSDRLAKASQVERKVLYNELVNQIRPHFVLNALEMLRLRAQEVQADDVAESAKQINQYLRYTMTADNNDTTLGDELLNVENYINLINSMRSEKVSYTVSYDAWTESVGLSCRIPAMILQPLVENSVKHGIKSTAHGSIHIDIAHEADTLTIYVEDNGCGMPADTLAKLKESISDMNGNISAHIGIKYVKKKLELSFPNHYEMDIDSVPDVGTSIIIQISFESQRAEKNNQQ